MSGDRRCGELQIRDTDCFRVIKTGGNLDIFVSHRAAWTSRGGHRKTSVISFDGTALYFYSNRPGGFGAQDLYVSTRTKLKGDD
jgi:hypothetical protein